MRNLALSDEILLKIEKPARYIGNEVNAAMKDKEAVSTYDSVCVFRMFTRLVCPI